MLERVEFIRGAQLILGGKHRPMSKFSPVALPGVPFVENADGDLQIWREDGRRITIPAESCKLKYRGDLSIEIPPVPATRTYQIESIYFGLDVSVYLDQLSTIDSWHRDKHHLNRDGHILTEATLHDRTVTITRPKGGTVDVPFHSIRWLVETPVMIPVDAFPVGEVTPTSPPKRAPKKGN